MKTKNVPPARIPGSTYRLQFNRRFRFNDALKVVGYLQDLGITDIYASPYFKARKGSLHGYDIVDPTLLNPEVGTEEEYDKFVRELRRRGMGQILDIVPNHLCADSDNPWWMDVLENGPCARAAGFFDIDWNPVVESLRNRLLLPVLADQYGTVLERQELSLSFKDGAFSVHYGDLRLPLQPGTYVSVLEHRRELLLEMLPHDNPHMVELLSIITALKHLPLPAERDEERVAERYREKEIIKKRLAGLCAESAEICGFLSENVQAFNGKKGDPGSFDLLDRLLDQQVWRLSFWRVASEEINFRRFFDINNIAAVHMEDEGVFRETHSLILKLIAEDKVTGLRVDHPDGLYNPPEYFRRLQGSCYARRQLPSGGEDPVLSDSEQPAPWSALEREYDNILLSNPSYRPFYITGEKILTKGEKIPEDWLILGTTGYDFLNSLNGIFVDSRNAKSFDTLYAQFIKSKSNFQDLVYEKKKLVMQVAMTGEVSTLGHYLETIAEGNRHTRDFTHYSLTRAIVETIAFFPVYRTYIHSPDVNDREGQYIEYAVAKAKRKNPAISASLFDFLKDVLLMKFPDDLSAVERRGRLDFVMRFQQITGPVMAKGLEDTAFYIYNRLVSLNEVGGSPERFGTPLEAFHGHNIERMKLWPHSLIASSTHDSKRGEDVRARINVLSEIPDQWRTLLMKAVRENKKKKGLADGQPVPDRNEEYLLYQTLLGAWPVALSDGDHDIFRNRIREYMLKAVREAKVHTSWINPDAAYEEALLAFIDAVMDTGPHNRFMKEFEPFQKMISRFGMLNSLSQTLLKITSPGVPDFYQGSETLDLNLVDPDNRGTVDFGARAGMLSELKQRESRIGPLRLARELCAAPFDGMTKLYLVYMALNFRKQHRRLFEEGDYIPLETAGPKAYHVCAFARRLGSDTALVIAPRFFVSLSRPETPPVGRALWKDSSILLPFEETTVSYHNALTGETVKGCRKGGKTILHLHDALATFPVALLAGDGLREQR